MPTFDLSITISVIIAIAAIISPIFTAIINNRHQLNLRKSEFNNQIAIKELDFKNAVYERTVIREKEIYFEFLSAVGKLNLNRSPENRSEYGRLYPLLLVRANSELTIVLKKLDHEIKHGQSSFEEDNEIYTLIDEIKLILDQL